jgi:biotin carboxylase
VSDGKERRRVLFVCRAASSENARTARAIAELENVQIHATDAADEESLIDTAVLLRDEHGSLERIVTTQETLLEMVAVANEALGLPGIPVETVRRTLNKSFFKAALDAGGINTPRYQVVTNPEEANGFVREIGFPIVLKSVAGSGALATFLIRSADDLTHALELAQGTSDSLMAEQYIAGQELCVDTITIGGEPQFYSICFYQPSILEAVEHPETQWSCVMPREMIGYKSFIEQGLQAIRALGIGNAMTHMEGFIDSVGRPWFTDATLRPAGARIAPMLAHTYDIDPYHAWARLAIDDCFDGPWERKYAVGTIFLRGVGAGSVQQVDGIEEAQKDLGELLVEARWPRIGAPKSATYTGDGFITIRHRETEVVQETLHRIAQSVKIAYSSQPQSAAETWGHRLRNFRELNRPAWDQAN